MDDQTKVLKEQWPAPEIGDDGQPVYDQNFFLALAHGGRELWNKWRAKTESSTPYINVTFLGVDFRKPENSTINFSGYLFGSGATFSDCVFADGPPGQAKEKGIFFSPGMAMFENAVFDDNANFYRAHLGGFSNFNGTRFGHDAYFAFATFGTAATFVDAVFGDVASFYNAKFSGNSNFSQATFGTLSNFIGTSFGHWARFSDAVFGNEARFMGLSDERWIGYRYETLDRFTPWPHSSEFKSDFLTWPEHAAARPDRLGSISFNGTRFLGFSDFRGRAITEEVDFTSAQFRQPPHFDTLAKIDFYGATIGFASTQFPFLSGWTTKSTVAIALRNLRKMADETNDHDLERNLFIEERKAERVVYLHKYVQQAQNEIRRHWRRTNSFKTKLALILATPSIIVATSLRLIIHIGWILAMGIYWALADYGRSFARPFIWLFVGVGVFHTMYWYALGPGLPNDRWLRAKVAIEMTFSWPNSTDSDFSRATRAFTLANTIPLVGSLSLDSKVKEALICSRPLYVLTFNQSGQDISLPPTRGCTPIPPLRLQLLALAQTILSTLCLFFGALALRNYFRVK